MRTETTAASPLPRVADCGARSHIPRQPSGFRRKGRAAKSLPLDNAYLLSRPGNRNLVLVLHSMHFATIAWNLLALVHAVVPNHAGDAQAIIGKNLTTAL